MLKPYCGAENKIPKGKRRGTMLECAAKRQVRYYGIKKVDEIAFRKALEKKHESIEKQLMNLKILVATLRGRISGTKKKLASEKDKKKLKELEKILKDSEFAFKQASEKLHKLNKPIEGKIIQKPILEKVKEKIKISNEKRLKIEKDINDWKKELPKLKTVKQRREVKQHIKKLRNKIGMEKKGLRKLKPEIKQMAKQEIKHKGYKLNQKALNKLSKQVANHVISESKLEKFIKIKHL